MSKNWGDPQYMKARWEALCGVAQDCTDCALHQQAARKVVGDPNQWDGPRAIVFLGEAPSANDEAEGIPFVDLPGQKLRQYIVGLRLPGDLFGIMHTVQCRPPGDRPLEPREINACSRFFMEKLRMWNPQVIIPLGKPACQTVFGISNFQITTSACLERKTNIKHGSYRMRIPAFPMPHPHWGIKNPEAYANMWGKLDNWLAGKGFVDRVEQ